jgi:hypothetical protein
MKWSKWLGGADGMDNMDGNGRHGGSFGACLENREERSMSSMRIHVVHWPAPHAVPKKATVHAERFRWYGRFFMIRVAVLSLSLGVGLAGCGSDKDTDIEPGEPIAPPAPSCESELDGETAAVAEPELLAELGDRWHEAWLGSPAVADLDGDGQNEIIAPRDNLLLGWHLDGEVVFSAETEGRIWASPVVADLLPSSPAPEIAAASRGNLYLWTADGSTAPGFPVSWQDELRSLAAGDIDGDGALELVAVTTNRLESGDFVDIIIAYNTDGSVVSGFPPNTGGSSGCDDACYVTGGFDQNVALGDINGDGVDDIFATEDCAYISLHEGDGRAFDAAGIFDGRTKVLGVRFLHDYSLAQQGWADDEESANQAHFTNSAPAIADLDGDGINDLVVLGSVQNAAQSDRYRGVALWAFHNDGTRLDDWVAPFHVPEYLSGLWDFEGTNVVAATNQVTVADIDPASDGPELLFAGFDGQIHCVRADASDMWSYTYTADKQVLTGGVVVADLSRDGAPEVIFNSYSPDNGKGHLFVLDGGGNERFKIALPGRGAMPVPTIADADGDGALEIIVSLKGGDDGEPQVLVYTVPDSSDNCLLWPTGRGNDLRNGYVPAE